MKAFLKILLLAFIGLSWLMLLLTLTRDSSTASFDGGVVLTVMSIFMVGSVLCVGFLLVTKTLETQKQQKELLSSRP